VQVDVKVPVLAESVAEATLMNWHKQPGDPISRGDSLIDIETDKVTLEVAALNDGVLVEILKGDGELVESNEVIARIDTEATAAGKQAAAAKVEAASEPQQQSLAVDEPQESSPKLSPAVRNLLQENKLNPEQIPVSGERDRLTKEDVVAYLDKKTDSPEATPTPEPAAAEPATETVASPPPVAAPAVIDTGDRPEKRVPMTRLRKRTAERLLSAQHENALLTTFNEVNMKPVMELRARYKDEFEKTHGVKLGFMSFFTRAAVEALKKFPLVNASIDGEDIVYHGYFDIGIAVSAPKGLVVPILRDADQYSFANIESNIRELGQKARDSKLTMEELTGGTFTITNGGIFGSLLSTPILNPPQSAILGMHKIQDRPVAENGEVVIRPVMYLALSYDHRIIDGREAVQFLVSIKEQIEDPARLLLQL
jgi:2-oxoglutarate dehydrogenase E2 component (dihydrolipoamide succinyltransferase)